MKEERRRESRGMNEKVRGGDGGGGVRVRVCVRRKSVRGKKDGSLRRGKAVTTPRL